RHRFELLEGVPLLRALNGHTWLTPLALVLPFALHILLQRTPFGLRVRTVGERPTAAATLGIPVLRLRTLCVVAGGLFAGLGGAALSLSVLDRFEQHMPAGLGFMAVAAMGFRDWSALGAAGAAVFFSAGSALRISLGSGVGGIVDAIPQAFVRALPYVLSLLALRAQGRRTGPPAAVGSPWRPGAFSRASELHRHAEEEVQREVRPAPGEERGTHLHLRGQRDVLVDEVLGARPEQDRHVESLVGDRERPPRPEDVHRDVHGEAQVERAAHRNAKRHSERQQEPGVGGAAREVRQHAGLEPQAEVDPLPLEDVQPQQRLTLEPRALVVALRQTFERVVVGPADADIDAAQPREELR